MKFLSFLLLVIVSPIHSAVAQSPKAQIDHIAPYPKAVPGQIMEARVQGIGESPMARVSTADCQIEITQDANKFTVQARTARNTFVSEPKVGQNLPPTPGPPDFSKMKALQSIGFVVPQGLHPGEAQVVVSYRNQQ